MQKIQIKNSNLNDNFFESSMLEKETTTPGIRRAFHLIFFYLSLPNQNVHCKKEWKKNKRF